MEWEGDEENVLVPAWICNPVSQGGSPTQCPIFYDTIECTWALLEFDMCTRYKSHNDASLSFMENALRHYHTFSEVFILRQAGQMAKAKANALRMELVKKRKVDKETNAET
jgi:hypothetical protein